MDPKTPDLNSCQPWVAPRLTTLDIAVTQAGASPNIEETVLTNATFAIS